MLEDGDQSRCDFHSANDRRRDQEIGNVEEADAKVDEFRAKANLYIGNNQTSLNTQQLGELVMRELKKLDKVAYVRFASVYRSFEDIDDFKTLVDEVRR